jgi:cytochrome c5
MRGTSFYGRVALWSSIALCTAAVATASIQEPPQLEKGEQILKDSCLSCHDLKPIAQQFMDKDEWEELIAMMLQRGAKLTAEDEPVLIDYLARKHGYQLPEGPGKEILKSTCKNACHSAQRIVTQHWSRARWDALLDEMISNGAEISDDDYPILLNYLARNFKPTQ